MEIERLYNNRNETISGRRIMQDLSQNNIDLSKATKVKCEKCGINRYFKFMKL